jgi:hypothetical protein
MKEEQIYRAELHFNFILMSPNPMEVHDLVKRITEIELPENSHLEINYNKLMITPVEKIDMQLTIPQQIFDVA